MNKPGWQTTEFWLGLIAAVATFLQSTITPQEKGLYVTIISIVYMISRAWIKSNESPK